MASTAGAPPTWSLSRWLSTSVSSRVSRARSSGTSTRWPASLSRRSADRRRTAAHGWRCAPAPHCPARCRPPAARTARARAAARATAAPAAAAADPAARSDHGRAAPAPAPPSTPASASPQRRHRHRDDGPGPSRPATADRPDSQPMAPAARSHSGGTSTPSMASGVTTSVTQGMASALAASPTTDTWPNSSSVSGVSATVITHCSRRPESTEPFRPLALVESA